MTLATKILFKNCIQNKLSTYFYSVNYVNINYFVKYSTVDCNYLLFLQDYFFRSKPKHYKNANIADCLKKHLETHKTCKGHNTVVSLSARLAPLPYWNV